MSTSFETLSVSRNDQGLSLVEINRPEKLNALNEQVLNELTSFFSNLSLSHGDRGVIITGSGEKAFVAGADIKAMSSMTSHEAESFGKLGQDLTILMEKSAVPVIAAVNGFALGGGCELAMAADIILCSDNALFGLPELTLGLIPGFGGTQRLAKNVGNQLAKEMIFCGRKLKGPEAVERGLALRSFSRKEDLLKEAYTLLERSIKMAPIALSEAKSAILSGVDLPTELGLKEELKGFKNVFETQDFKEGVSAFLEKRPAEFKGI